MSSEPTGYREPVQPITPEFHQIGGHLLFRLNLRRQPNDLTCVRVNATLKGVSRHAATLFAHLSQLAIERRCAGYVNYLGQGKQISLGAHAYYCFLQSGPLPTFTERCVVKKYCRDRLTVESQKDVAQIVRLNLFVMTSHRMRRTFQGVS